MTGEERREAIFRRIETAGRASVGDLAGALRVTPATIRSDLSKLETTGQVVRLHGAVVLSRHSAAERAFAENRLRNMGAKQRIGEAAAGHVNDGDAIILDAGTTTLEIARRIKDRARLLVLTNGLDIATELSRAPGIELVMLGGRLRKSALSFSGPTAEQTIGGMRFDTLFLGVDALDARHGLMAEDEDEARLNRTMIAVAERTIAVCDSSKAERRGVFQVAAFSALARLVTDDGLPERCRNAARAAGTEVEFA